MIKNLLDLDIEIWFEEDIGLGINSSNKVFEDAGLKKHSREDCLKNGNLIITNQALDIEELKLIKSNSTILGKLRVT